MSSDEALAEVGLAADTLVAAFGGHDREAYFAAFAPEATFVFHTSPTVLGSRAEYEREWDAWEQDGFHVDGCETFDRVLTPVSDDVVVMTHRVRTRLSGEPEVQRERETIVFARTEGDGGGWLAVHEHLSPDPATEG